MDRGSLCRKSNENGIYLLRPRLGIANTRGLIFTCQRAHPPPLHHSTCNLYWPRGARRVRVVESLPKV